MEPQPREILHHVLGGLFRKAQQRVGGKLPEHMIPTLVSAKDAVLATASGEIACTIAYQCDIVTGLIGFRVAG